MKKILIIIIIIVVIITGYFLIDNLNNQSNISNNIEDQDKENWEEYESEEYKFTFQHPQHYEIRDSEKYAKHNISIINPENRVGDNLEIKIRSISTIEKPYEGSLTQISISENDTFFEVDNNRWVSLPDRDLVCKKITSIGKNNIPSYHQYISDAGIQADTYLIITKENTFLITLWYSSFSHEHAKPEPNMEKIISTFELTNNQEVITAKCN